MSQTPKLNQGCNQRGQGGFSPSDISFHSLSKFAPRRKFFLYLTRYLPPQKILFHKISPFFAQLQTAHFLNQVAKFCRESIWHHAANINILWIKVAPAIRYNLNCSKGVTWYIECISPSVHERMEL